VWNRLPVAVVAVGVVLALYGAGVVSVDEAFAGFGDPTVIFIASLFVVSEALDATGVTAWASDRLVRGAGERTGVLVAALLVLAAAVSAVITPNGAVAALLPVTVLVALRLGRAPSKLLMPMAFSAHAGSLVLLTGSPVNVIVAEEADRLGEAGFGFFEFAAVGVPLTIGAVAIALLLGPRLLPARRPREMSADLSDHARTLARQYAPAEAVPVRHEVPEPLFTREAGVAEVVIPPRSPLIGAAMFPGMVTESGDLVVLAIQRGGAAPPPAHLAL
jgi:di/tricarboxylate transporter